MQGPKVWNHVKSSSIARIKLYCFQFLLSEIFFIPNAAKHHKLQKSFQIPLLPQNDRQSYLLPTSGKWLAITM